MKRGWPLAPFDDMSRWYSPGPLATGDDFPKDRGNCTLGARERSGPGVPGRAGRVEKGTRSARIPQLPIRAPQAPGPDRAPRETAIQPRVPPGGHPRRPGPTTRHCRGRPTAALPLERCHMDRKRDAIKAKPRFRKTEAGLFYPAAAVRRTYAGRKTERAGSAWGVKVSIDWRLSIAEKGKRRRFDKEHSFIRLAGIHVRRRGNDPGGV